MVFDFGACKVPTVLEIRVVGCPLGSYFYVIFLDSFEMQVIPYVHLMSYHQIFARDQILRSPLCSLEL